VERQIQDPVVVPEDLTAHLVDRVAVDQAL
jgi:hypothetical protein